MLKRILLTLLLLGLSANALAAGRAACRIEWPLNTVCFAEEVLANYGPVEIAGGAEVRFAQADPFQIVPYAALGVYQESWFSVLEFRAPIIPDITPSVGFKFSLTAGISW